MESLHHLLLKTYTQVNRRISHEAASLGLSPGQPKILECLLQCGELHQKAIADSCEIEPATVGSILLRMERDGLIQRTQRVGDRRSLYVSLTPKGEAVSRRIEDIFRQIDLLAASRLSMEEQIQLRSLLETVCSAISSSGEETA